MTIRILADEVASQIAAGEVIERPASVVKELIENAIDAGATQISIRIENAGKRLIEIADNGCGIPADELETAVCRHATSKLEKAEDLVHIRTLGFRGEALAAAASVSRLRITSLSANCETGTTILVDGGHTMEICPTASVKGTIIRVEDLFYNVPARLKFLKTDQTEKAQIETLISRYAYAYPMIRWQLRHEQKLTLQTSGNGDQREILNAIYGLEIAKQMIEVSLDEEEFSIGGYISPIALTRANRKEINFFVNGRWVQDFGLTSATLRAYQSLIMVGRYPIVSLFLRIPPEFVDVNVHPAKSEIRIRNADRVFSLIHRALRRSLMFQSPIPEITPQNLWGSWHTEQIKPEFSATAEPPSESDSNSAHQANINGSEIPYIPWQLSEPAPYASAPLQSSTQPIAYDFPILRWIGQIGTTYLLAEGPDGLYLIDQHAAHERVLYEKLIDTQSDTENAQFLTQPLTLNFSPQQAAILSENLDLLQKFGFQIEDFGPSTFRITAIPALFMRGDPASAIRSLTEEFEEDESALQRRRSDWIAARVCKRMAVKAGQILSAEEQRSLLHDLEQCRSPRTCPHGRPTMIHISIHLLEKQFGRKP